MWSEVIALHDRSSRLPALLIRCVGIAVGQDAASGVDKAVTKAAFLTIVWGLHRLRAQQLRREERKLREAIETIPAMASIVASDGAVQFRNRRGVEYTGLSQSGIAEGSEKADQIFDAFFTTKPQGSGMGLAISRSIMESHGGRLWATSHERQGATFRVTLPRR